MSCLLNKSSQRQSVYMSNTERQQIFTFEKLEPENVKLKE